MAGDRILVDPQILLNNQALYFVPNTGSFTEGKGAQTKKTASGGGGVLKTVYSKDVSTAMSKLKITLYSTKKNIAIALAAKDNEDDNILAIVDGTDFNRVLNNGALITDYEINFKAEGTFEIEFHGDPVSA